MPQEKLSLLKSDPAQSKITDCYTTVENVEKFIASTPEFIGMFNFSTSCLDSSQSSEINPSSNVTKFCSLFRKTVENVNKNAENLFLR